LLAALHSVNLFTLQLLRDPARGPVILSRLSLTGSQFTTPTTLPIALIDDLIADELKRVTNPKQLNILQFNAARTDWVQYNILRFSE
jgi:hypothetical protein